MFVGIYIYINNEGNFEYIIKSYFYLLVQISVIIYINDY